MAGEFQGAGRGTATPSIAPCHTGPITIGLRIEEEAAKKVEADKWSELAKEVKPVETFNKLNPPR